MIKTIDLKCEQCGKNFTRRLAEHTRNLKKNRKVFCSLHCMGLANTPRILPYKGQNNKNLVIRKIDDLSPFRCHLHNINTHCCRPKIKTKTKNCSITLQDLKEQWNKQKGICPYTGWKLINKQGLSQKYKLPLTPNRASVDRIDPKKDYTKDNIQFIAIIAQFAKHTFTEQQLLDFCKVVVENNKCLKNK